jgi:hypothetical protein
MTDIASAPTAPATPPGFFSSVIAWGKQELATIEGETVTLWNAIAPQIVTEAETLGGQFLGAALTAVQTQAGLALSGREKFSNAKDAVLEAVEASGQTIGNTLVEFLVNLALALVKAGTGASLL